MDYIYAPNKGDYVRIDCLPGRPLLKVIAVTKKYEGAYVAQFNYYGKIYYSPFYSCGLMEDVWFTNEFYEWL